MFAQAQAAQELVGPPPWLMLLPVVLALVVGVVVGVLIPVVFRAFARRPGDLDARVRDLERRVRHLEAGGQVEPTVPGEPRQPRTTGIRKAAP